MKLAISQKAVGTALLLAAVCQARYMSARLSNTHHTAVGTRQDVFDRRTASLDEFQAFAYKVAMSRLGPQCTADQVRIRKSWYDLTPEERLSYTRAVRCLQTRPPRTPSVLAPGVRTRYDDFVGTHINQTQMIHFNGAFLGWHRMFVREYERALRDECGYLAPLPYWDWARTAVDGLANSPLFDGSPTSLSGDGAPLHYKPTDVIILDLESPYPFGVSPGTGGGCVTSGPFANYTVNMGPVALTDINGNIIRNADLLRYNPRCLRRSLTDEINRRFANGTSILRLYRQADDVATLQTFLAGIPEEYDIGVHAGAHYCLGGDPGRDLYASPGDPAFYLLHAQLDKIWWEWQMLDPASRVDNEKTALSGYVTANDYAEPHRQVTGDDLQNTGWAGDGLEHRLGDLLDTTNHGFCYVYV